MRRQCTFRSLVGSKESSSNRILREDARLRNVFRVARIELLRVRVDFLRVGKEFLETKVSRVMGGEPPRVREEFLRVDKEFWKQKFPECEKIFSEMAKIYGNKSFPSDGR